MRISDWSSDVCSSDLNLDVRADPARTRHRGTETALDRTHVERRYCLVPGLFRTRCRVGPRQPQDQRAHRKRRVCYQWTEDLDQHRQRSEEHTSALKPLMRISYAVFCLKKTITQDQTYH